MYRKTIYLLVGGFLITVASYAKSVEQVVESYFNECSQYISLDNYDSAFYYADLALALAKSENYSWGKSHSTFLKGLIRFEQNELSESLLYYLDALRIMQAELADDFNPEERAGLHLNIGRIYRKYSNFLEAHKFYDEGLIIAQNYSLKHLEILFTYNKGVASKYDGESIDAFQLFLNARLLAEEAKNYKWVFNSINQLGLVNKDLGRYDSARRYFEEALPITELIKNRARYEAMIFHNTANTYFQEENYNEAEKWFKKSLDKRPRFISYKDLAEMYVLQERYGEAISMAEKAELEYAQQGQDTDDASIFKTLGKSYLALGDSKLADAAFDRYTFEIDKYLENREYAKKLEDAYQIDLLTKQYFLKLEEQKQQAKIAQLSWYLAGVVLMFLIIFGLQRYLAYRKKSHATDAIKAIFNQSELLRGSLDREL